MWPRLARLPSKVTTVALTELDRSLLARCLGQDPAGWRDFVDRFVGLFYHVADHVAESRSMRLTADDREDVAAEIFFALLKDNSAALRRFKGNSSLATYLSVIARRVAVQQLAQKRTAEAMGHVVSHAAAVDQTFGTSGETARIENREVIERMLVGLPETDARVVRGFHLEGRSYREISVALGIAENSVGPTLSRALDRLRHNAPQFS
jgi:RNA polymerase sigma-70 factor (ECF subfamily)